MSTVLLEFPAQLNLTVTSLCLLLVFYANVSVVNVARFNFNVEMPVLNEPRKWKVWHYHTDYKRNVITFRPFIGISLLQETDKNYDVAISTFTKKKKSDEFETLHWNFNHFIVQLTARCRFAVLIDYRPTIWSLSFDNDSISVYGTGTNMGFKEPMN